MDNDKALTKIPIEKMKTMLSTESVKNQFRNALQDSAPLFVASLIDVYGGDKYLQKCAPGAVIMEALKAATLRLPINKSLGFAYIIAYKDVPSFQLGYKGLIQLAMRTGQYKYINADVVYEGEEVKTDRVSGATTITGEPKSDVAAGYFAYIQMLNGFEKMIYWPKAKVISHAKKFSKTYGGANSSWATNFDAMALKTMIRNLLSKYGIMSVEMISAMSSDTDERNPEARADEEIEREANAGDVIDVEVVPESEMQSTGTDGPSF